MILHTLQATQPGGYFISNNMWKENGYKWKRKV